MDADFSCERPFDIDKGELDGLSRSMCFVLGYEVCQVDALLRRGIEFSKPIHSANRDRIEAELQRQNREYELEWPSDDVSESWIHLVVAPQ